jgi:hypothetical protein
VLIAPVSGAEKTGVLAQAKLANNNAAVDKQVR